MRFLLLLSLTALSATKGPSDEGLVIKLVKTWKKCVADNEPCKNRPSDRDGMWATEQEARDSFTRHETLHDLGKKYGTDKVRHGFLQIYADLFGAPEAVKNMMEIGVFYGASIQMWRDYFVNAKVYGVDGFTGIMGNGKVECPQGSCIGDLYMKKEPFGPRVKLVKADQGDSSVMEGMAKELQKEKISFDVIVEDGSHKYEDQQKNLAQLFPLIKPGGYYVIEDLHSSLQKGYDAPARSYNTTLEVIKRFMSTNSFDSPYLSDKQKRYLDKTIAFARPLAAWNRTMASSSVCILRKK